MKYWTETLNPVIGCRPASAGCLNCWAAAMASRMASHTNRKISDRYEGVVKDGAWTGLLRRDEDAEDKPRSHKKPRVYAVCWMGDLFADDVPKSWQTRVFDIMLEHPRHTYLLLTKRPHAMAAFAVAYAARRRLGRYPDGMWFGATIESHKQAQRAWSLHTIPGRRWLSVEPLLGPIYTLPLMVTSEGGGMRAWTPYGDVEQADSVIEVVIAGPETGSGARPCEPRWLEEVEGLCNRHGGVVFARKDVKEHRGRLPW